MEVGNQKADTNNNCLPSLTFKTRIINCGETFSSSMYDPNPRWEWFSSFFSSWLIITQLNWDGFDMLWTTFIKAEEIIEHGGLWILIEAQSRI
jgi:hypothetical protein